MSAKERTELERLQARGQTYEEALTQIGSNRAAGGMRDEMEKRERDVRIAGRVAERTLERARKIEDAGPMPIHPRSPAAEELRRATQPTHVHIPDEDLAKSLDGVPMLDPDWTPFDG